MNVLITGAAGGLGRAMAVECGKRGYNVFLTDVNSEGLNSVCTGLVRRFGINAAMRTCDLTNPDSVDDLIDFIDKCGIKFDMLLNIAGVDFEGGFLSRPRESITKIVSLNNVGTLRITHAALQCRRKEKNFTVVFVSSLASMFPMPLKATYAASKRFLLDFAISLRQELRGENVNVMVLCPAGMETKDDTIEAIRAQGFWGDITTNPLETVASKTIDKALAGRAIYVPGTVNRILLFAGRLIPKTWVAGAVYYRWKKTQSRWLNANQS